MAQYIELITTFGGMNTRLSPEKLPPGMAQLAVNVDLTGGTIQARLADEQHVTASYLSMYEWGATLVGSTTQRYHFTEWGLRLFRANYRPDSTKAVPQFTNATKYASGLWDAVGIKAPPVACTTADAGSGAGPNGTYQHYVTFYNSDGDESPPSPASTALAVVDNDISLSVIPIGYGTGDIASNTTISNVTNITSYRVGMRLASPSAGIPAGTYITAVGVSTLTISQAATATTVGVTLQDAQVTGRKVYRSGGTVASTLLLTTIADVTTTTYNDTTADTALGAAITTSGYDVFPVVGGFDINPAGVLAGIAPGSTTGEGTVFHFSSPGLPTLTKSTYTIAIPEPAGRVFWGLERFCIFATSSVYGVIGTDSTNYEILRADGRAPSIYYDPVDMGAAIWYVSNAGVMTYDGNGIRCVSRDFLADNASFASDYGAAGACRVGDRFFCFGSLNILEYNPALALSPWVRHDTPNITAQTETTYCVAYSRTYDRALVATTTYVWRFQDGTSGWHHSYEYLTGFLPFGNHLSMKKIRASVVCGIGPWASYMGTDPRGANYIGRTTIGNVDAWAGLNDGEPNPTYFYERRKAWQASGFKGRGVVFYIGHGTEPAYVPRAYTQRIDEIGVYVGEQRRAVP